MADSWFGDAGLLAYVAIHQQGAVVVQGKSSYVFHLPGGRRMTGQDFVTRADRPWHDSAQFLGSLCPAHGHQRHLGKSAAICSGDKHLGAAPDPGLGPGKLD